MKTVKMLALLMLVAAVAGAAVSGALILAEKGVIHVDSLAVSAPGLQSSVAATQPANQAAVRKVRFIDRIRGLRDVFKPVKEDPQTPPPLEAALGDWVEYSSQPLASIPHKAYYPTVIYDAAGFGSGTPLYKMWYDAESSRELYSSTDGITWTRVGSLSGLSGSPAHTTVKYFSSGFTGVNSGNNQSSATMKYRIWYWHGLVYTIADIYYAESPDGLTWYNDQSLQQGTPALITGPGGSGWNRGSYGSVEIIYNASATNTGANPFDYSFAMYYDGTTGNKESIGLAYSANGIFWTAYVSEPVFAGSGYLGSSAWNCPTGCAWDCGYVSRPTVFKTATGFEMWYSGGITTVNVGIGHAVSRDGFIWTRDPRGAIFTKDDGLAWRDDRTYASWVVNVNGALKMWYSGRDAQSPNEYRIGLATPANWTFYVNSAWAGTADGVEVPAAGSGKYFGFNAFSSIQRAIDMASNGTTIQVATGTYTEFVNVNKSVTLIGADQNDPTADPMITNQSLTIIQPPATGSATTDAVLKVVASNATISHLTVTGNNGGLHARYGIYVVNTGGLGLHDIVVQYCMAYGFSNVPSGGDYYTSDSSSGNTQGGGIYVEGMPSPLPTVITLDRNIVHDVYFGMYLDTSDGTISNNYVYNSEAAISTWGIGTGSTTRYLIDNTIENSGRALLVNGVNSGNPVVFSGNKATNVVRGLEARYSRQLITIENNEIQATTTGMLLKPQETTNGYLIRNNTITGTNAAGSIGIDAYAYNSTYGTVLTAVVENNDLSGFETGIRAFKDPSYITTRTIGLTIGGAAGKTNVIRATGGDNHSLLLQNCNNAITATYNDWGAYPESRILHQVDNGALGLVTFNPWAGGCYVDGSWYENGDGNPANPCQACNSSLDIAGWSNAADGTSCEGTLFCAENETCSSGVCGGGDPVICDDGIACTLDACNETVDACVFIPNNAACNDGNPCTDDVCDVENGCTLVMNTASCDDGVYCNGVDTCSGGSCHSAGNPCPENGNVCDGVTSCDEAGDQCVTSAAPTCNDGLYCNGVETCDPASGCVAGTPPDCAIDDHISCTIDACDEATDQCAHTYDPAVNPCVVSAGGSIQTAINTVNPGTTIRVEAGTYAESLTINKKIILEGAGSGDDPATATIINAPGTGAAAQKGAFIRASGATASDRLTVKDLRFTDSYAGIYFDTTVSHVAIDNVVATAGVNGLEFEAAGGTIITVSDLAISNSSFNENIETSSGMGIRVSKRATIDGLNITNSHFDSNNRGWYAQRTTADGVTDITNVLVEDSTFDNNGYKAINLEKLSNATFNRISVDSSGACPAWYHGSQSCDQYAAGLELNLKYANYANITVENSTFNASGMMSAATGVALAFKARDDGSSYGGANAATLTNVTVRGNFFSNNQNALFLGEPGKNNLTPTNVVIEHNSFVGSLAKEIQNNCQATPNAGANWLGETDHVLVAGRVAGTLDYTPWLDTGDDQSTDPGFQPDLAYLHVGAAGAQSGTTGRIQEAIGLVSEGGTVEAHAGLYDERIKIAKALTLLGATKNISKKGYAVPVDYAYDTNVETVIRPSTDINWPVVAIGAMQDPPGTSDADMTFSAKVTIDGLVVANQIATAAGIRELIYIPNHVSAPNGIEIKNCVVGPNTGSGQTGVMGRSGITKAGPSYARYTKLLINNNKIFDAKGDGCGIMIVGPFGPSYDGPFYAERFAGSVIENNEITGNHRSGIEMAGGVQGSVGNPVMIRNNLIANTGWRAVSENGMLKYGNGLICQRAGSDKLNADAVGCKYLQVENNEIRDNEKNGIYLGPMNSEMTFSGNLIQNNGSGAGGYLRWDGVRLDLTELYYSTASNGGIGGTPVGYQGVLFPANLVFNGNNILDNDSGRPTPAKYGIKVVQVATNPAGAVVATGNWWGDYTGPYHVSTNTAGLGSPVTDYVLFGVASNPGDPTQEWSKAPNGGLECPGCLIAGVCYLVSQTDPLNVCKVCAVAGATAFADNDGVSCDDGTVCDGADVCSGGTCSLHVNPLDCDDGNLCTDDSCDAAAGCLHADNTDPCDDGNACTVNDTCDGGACASGAARNCDDGLYCNGAETCDPASGCVAASPISCGYLDDHISCTIEECDENTNQCVTRYDPSVNPCVVSAGGKIQDAINIVNPGATVQVVAGTYAENLTIKKYLILDGAGSGADPGVDTIIDPSSGHGITIISAGSGASATDRTVIKDLRVTGAAQGVRFDSNATIKWVTLNNVATVGNTEPGINLREVSTYEDLLFEDIVSTGNSAGVQIQTTATVLNGLTVDGATLSNNTIAGFLALGGSLTNVAIKNATVQNNASGVGTDADIVLTGFNGNLEISDTAVTSNNAESAIRVTGNGTLAAAGTMLFKNITLSGTQAMVGTYPSAALVLTRYTDTAAVSFDNVILDSAAPAGLFLGTLSATTPPALDLDGVTFSGTYPKYIQLGRHGNSTSYSKANAAVDATGAVFTGVTDPFAIEDKIDHKLDDAELGLVTWVADNLYVTPASGSIQRGINAAGATGWTVNVAAGSYDENLSINKPLSLLGAQAGEDARGRTGVPESIITKTTDFSRWLVLESASNVTIDGFTLMCPTPAGSGEYTGISVFWNSTTPGYPTAWVEDVVIKNNIIKQIGNPARVNAPDSVGIEIGPRTDGIEITQNEIRDIGLNGDSDGGWSPIGIITWGDGGDSCTVGQEAKNINIHHNKIHDISNTAVGQELTPRGINISMCTENAIVADNEIYNVARGIVTSSWSGGPVDILRNSIHNCTFQGIRAQATATTIDGNTITENPTGIFAKPSTAKLYYTDLHLDVEVNNNIQGNTNYGIYAEPTGSQTVLVDATSNWWGDYRGPRHNPDKPLGGDLVSDYVNYGTVLAKPANGATCPGCEISGVCYLVSQTDPLNVCLICATAGATAFVPNDGVSCDDGTVCDGADTCSGGTCSLHVNPLDCNDGNPCTDDACDMVAGCVNVANTASCDDGVWCNGADTCENKTCTVHAGDPCPENSNVCDGITSCDEGADQCVTTAALTCDDGNPCTDDSCAPTTGCAFTNDDTNTCDDGQFCTDNDACTAGVCGGTAHSCDDKVTCTDDACNETNDTCDYTSNGQDCEVGAGGNIQNAINAADPGDVILLADAVFPVDDPLVISKSLILRGQGTGTTTIDGGANPGDYGQTCDAGGVGDNWPRGILVTANNVTIDHLKIKNFQGDRNDCYGYGVLARGVESYSGVPGGTILTGLHLHEVEFVDTTLGARLSETDGAIIEDSTYEVINGEPADSFHLNYSTNALIQNNTLTDGDIWVAKGSHNARILNNHITDAPANCIWAGVNFTGLDLSNSPTIVGNTLDGCFEGGIVLWGKTGEVTTNALIADNTITGVEGGPAGYDDHGGISIFAGEYTNLIVRDNDSSNNLGDQAGLYIRSAKLNSATITGNKFSHNLGRGVWINKVTRVAVDLRYNSIYGNALGGVEVAAGSGTDVDARQSWWGDASGPYHATLNPHGLGNSVSNYVLFGDYDSAEPGTMAPACRGDAGQICLTNVSTRQFTVSWSTFGANEKGYLKYGTSPTNLNQTAYDDRGSGIYDENHHITLASLPTPPGTTYYYEVVSGGVTHRNGAQPFSVTTAPSIGIPAFDDKMMQVFLQDGATASKGTLVYAKLKNDLAEAPNPSLGESAWLSTVLKDDDGGVWGVPLGNFREANLGAYFSYEGADNIFVFADGAQDGFSTYEGNIADDIPSIVLNNCDGCFINQVCYLDGTKPTPTAPLVDTCEICDITRSRSTWSPVAAAILCRPEATVCDVAESCDGTHTYCPTDAFASTATVCRPVAGICDVVEMCTGTSSVCPVDAFVAPTVECRASSGICDVAENCTGTGALCPSDEVKPSGTECRAKADFCDVAEACDGSAKTCPVDAFAPSTLECRAAAGICDVAENCTGGAAACPADAKQPSGTECRAKTAFCDVAESCNGAANTCPVDAFVTAGTVCNAASTDPSEMCDADDVCAGTSAACIEKWKPSTQSCRTAVNNCDVTEFCTGSLKTCPVDGFQPTSFMCNAKGSDPCDADDYCAGDSATCTPMFAPSSTVCRAVGSQGSAVDCDIAELCSGSSLGCPADAFQPAGSTCNDGQSCTSPDQCNGAGVCAGPPNSGPFVSVTAPAVAANYPGGGGTANITWNYGVCPVGGSNGVAGVDIKASLDGGATYPVLIATGAPDSGSYAWTLPAINESRLRIKVEAKKGDGSISGNDAMDGNFAVYMPVSIGVTVGTDGKVTLTWAGGAADVYWSTKPFSSNPADWQLFAQNVTSGWKDLTSAAIADTYYRLANTGKTALSAEIAGKTKTTLASGYTLITPHFQHAGTIKAQDILDQIGTTAKSIMRWDAGAQWWNIHYRQYPTYNNFVIEPGVGYFIEINGASTYWTTSGLLIQDLFTAPFSFDYTLMGFPTGEWEKAQNVLAEVTSQGGTGNSIYGWDSGSQWWNIHYNQYPTNNNFAIEIDEGYFVKNTNYSGLIADFDFNPLDVVVLKDADSFNVSWTSKLDATGWLLFYGTNPANTPVVVFDDSDLYFDRDTEHSVTVEGLSAGTYYYDIVMSGVAFNLNGNHHVVTLP